MSDTSRQRCIYILSDFVTGNLAWFLFNLIRYYTLPYNYSSMSLSMYYAMPMVLLGQLIFPLLMIALFAVSGFYNEVFFKSRVENIVNTFGVSLLGSIIIFFVALFNDSIDDRLKNYEMVAILWMLIGLLTLIPRLFITFSVSSRIKSRKISFNTLIVGISPKALSLADDLGYKYPDMGFNIVGFVDDHSCEGHPTGASDLPVYDIDDLPDVVESRHIDSFIVAHSGTDMSGTVSTVNRLFPFGKSVFITPDLLHFITLRPRTRMVSGEVLIDVSKSQIPPSTLNIKRISDVVVSAMTIVAISPLLAVIAVLVKHSSPGPVIYKQERVGYKKKPFFIYKFRSMYVGSEADGPALASSDDKRITPLGRVLRKYRLDELPQFWNVLKGDMSIVGPRPEREFYLRQIIARAPYFSLLHQVRPGITSWGMVKYGYAQNVDEMLERAKYDLLYIDNVSLIVDLKILFYTLETIISGKGV